MRRQLPASRRRGRAGTKEPPHLHSLNNDILRWFHLPPDRKYLLKGHLLKRNDKILLIFIEFTCWQADSLAQLTLHVGPRGVKNIMNFLSPRKKSTSSQPIVLGLSPWPLISFSLPDYNLISTRNFGLEFPFNTVTGICRSNVRGGACAPPPMPRTCLKWCAFLVTGPSLVCES